MYFKTDFYFLWRDFQYRNITSFKQFSKKAKILGQSMCGPHYAEQNGISYSPPFFLQSKKKKVRCIQREALAPYSVVIGPRVLTSKKIPLCCLSEFCGMHTYKTESCTFTQYFFGITSPKVFALRSLRQKDSSYSFESKASRKVFFAENLKAGLFQKEKSRRQGIQKERANNILSGEIFKERFTDILQTSLEQVGFSLKLNNEKSYKACRTTIWKKLQDGTNRRLPYFPPLSFSFLLSFPAPKVLQSFEKKHRKRLCSTKLMPYQEYGQKRDTKPNKIALTIKIGDYLSSGDKIGEKAFYKKRVLQKNKSLFAHRPNPCKQKDLVANKALFCSQTNLLTSTNPLTNVTPLSQRFVGKFVSNTAYKAKLARALTNLRDQLSFFAEQKFPRKQTRLTNLQFVCLVRNRNATYKTKFCNTSGERKWGALLPQRKWLQSEALYGALRLQSRALFAFAGAKVGEPSGHAEQNLAKLPATSYKSPIGSKSFATTKKNFVRTTITPSYRTNSGFKVNTLLQKRRRFQNISTPIILGSSGRIVTISKTQVIVQKTQPVLFYKSANLHIKKGSWVKQGSPILTLTHQTLITGDIVQGIPRIEQLFEAFTSPPPAFKEKGEFTKFTDGYNTLHSQVRDIFRNNWLKNRLPIAVRKSLEEIGYILVEMIQKVYLSQGVLIADKHIEIIVRQIASKGQILDSGTTGLFLEEVLPIRQIENANLTTPGKKSLYVPAVMGLTAAALNSDSFISAASFQETTRVLSRDAVVGKSDFLRGLKEKVVIGDLISAGTGLDLYFIYTTMLTS